ncbi:MAG: hypothetical protein U0795_23300 [Pirellulales bacterium]
MSRTGCSPRARIGTLAILCVSLNISSASQAQFYNYGALGDFFVIGIDAQPVRLYDTWKSRGVNTVVRIDRDTLDQIDEAVVRLGMKAIRDAKPVSALDKGRSYLLASNSPSDEPELKFNDFATGVSVQFGYQEAAKNSGLPFFTNYAGAWMLGDPWESRDYCGLRGDAIGQYCYGEYFRATDWISFDYYPMNFGGDINSITTIMNRIESHFKTSGQPLPPRFAYIEASDFDCDGRGPTASQVGYEAVSAVIAGARGIIYFPHKVGQDTPEGFAGCAPLQRTADGTTPETQREMTRLNLALAAVPPQTMQGWVNPDGVFFESGTASGQIIWGTRKDDSEAYYFTANNSDTNEYTHEVQFWGIDNCDGKSVTVINDTLDPNKPDGYTSRTIKLDGSCHSVMPETWAPRQFHIYKVATGLEYSLGDFDVDGDVDSVDLLEIVADWTGSLSSGEGSADSRSGDLDGDADVDSADLVEFLGHWTGQLEAASPEETFASLAASVPEPTAGHFAASLLTVAALVMGREKRRR